MTERPTGYPAGGNGGHASSARGVEEQTSCGVSDASAVRAAGLIGCLKTSTAARMAYCSGQLDFSTASLIFRYLSGSIQLLKKGSRSICRKVLPDLALSSEDRAAKLQLPDSVGFHNQYQKQNTPSWPFGSKNASNVPRMLLRLCRCTA